MPLSIQKKNPIQVECVCVCVVINALHVMKLTIYDICHPIEEVCLFCKLKLIHNHLFK